MTDRLMVQRRAAPASASPGKVSLTSRLPAATVQAKEWMTEAVTRGFDRLSETEQIERFPSLSLEQQLIVFGRASYVVQLNLLRAVPTRQARLIEATPLHRQPDLLYGLEPERRAAVLGGRRPAELAHLVVACLPGTLPRIWQAIGERKGLVLLELVPRLVQARPDQRARVVAMLDDGELRTLGLSMSTAELAAMLPDMPEAQRGRLLAHVPPDRASDAVLDATVQRRAAGDPGDPGDARADHVHARAAAGVAGAGGPLPHGERIAAAFGRHDTSAISAHVGGAATDACHGIGALAYATGNHVAFAAAPDLHTAAHEAAHVVQQRAGVHLAGGVGQAGDRYEQHADAVADAVVAGRSAEALLDPLAPGETAAGPDHGAVSRRAVQAFDAGEHESMADAGASAGGVRQGVQLAHDYHLTWGEVTALAGDHFETIDQMRQFAGRTGGGAASRAEIEYALEWKLHKPGRVYDDAARSSQERRYYTLAGDNSRHFVNPNERDLGRSTRDKAHDLRMTNGHAAPANAVAGYRMNHVRALIEAVEAGDPWAGSSRTLESAFATDAFACHFLTDSFSAGHLRTPRTEIRDYWNAKVPDFYEHTVSYMSKMIARHLPIGYRFLPWVGTVIYSRLSKVLAELAPIHFGDLVGLAFHDSDDQNGVVADVAGNGYRLYGDGHAGQGAEAELATRAVRRSKDEVERARQLSGQGSPERVAEQLLDGAGLYSAEHLIPTILPRTGRHRWQYDSYRELLDDPDFERALRVFAAEKAAVLTEIAGEFDETIAAAIGEGVVEPLREDPRAVIKGVIQTGAAEDFDNTISPSHWMK